MNNFDTLFPNFLNQCTEMNRVLTPISFVLLAILSMLILAPMFGYFGFGIERFRATKAMSVPQYIEMRYSRRLRILTGILNSAAGVFQMCVFPIVGAYFLQVLTKAPESVRIAGYMAPTVWVIMVGLLALNIAFTWLGGYLTLMVTNFFNGQPGLTGGNNTRNRVLCVRGSN